MSVFYVNSTIIKHNITYICHEFRRVEYVGKEEKAREEERITSVCSVERGLQVIGPATHVVTITMRSDSRGERERATEVETRSAKKFLAMARRRKRSPFQSVRNNV